MAREQRMTHQQWETLKVQDFERLEAENERLRVALATAAGRLGHLSTVLSILSKPLNAKEAWEWSEEARAAQQGAMSQEVS